MKSIVKNLPADLSAHLSKNNGVVYVTATEVDGELWFYGLWYNKAEAVKSTLGTSRYVITIQD